MNKLHKVIMLSTDKASNIYLDTKGRLLYTESDNGNQHLYLTSDEEIKEGDWRMITTENGFQYPNNTLNLDSVFERKIIASTDKSLISYNPRCTPGKECVDIHCLCEMHGKLPQIPESFIEAYVKAQGKITEVLVEYENKVDSYDKTDKSIDLDTVGFKEILKLRPDNTCIIHQSKTYSREEVIDIIYKSSYVLSNGDTTKHHADKWIEENLK